MTILSAVYSARMHACLLYALVFLCAYRAAGGEPFSPKGLVWAAGVYLVMQFSYVFNRIQDRDEDAFNDDRFPAYAVFRRPAAALLPAGMLLPAALYVHPASWPVALYGLVVIPLYSWRVFPLKRFLLFKPLSVAVGFFLVSVYLPISVASMGRPVHPGGLFGLFYAMWHIVVLFFLNSVFLDLRDEEGDSRAGVRTIPSAMGLNNAALLLTMLFAALSLTLFMIGRYPGGFIAAFLAGASAVASRGPGRQYYNHVILLEDAACMAALLI